MNEDMKFLLRQKLWLEAQPKPIEAMRHELAGRILKDRVGRDR